MSFWKWIDENIQIDLNSDWILGLFGFSKIYYNIFQIYRVFLQIEKFSLKIRNELLRIIVKNK